MKTMPQRMDEFRLIHWDDAFSDERKQDMALGYAASMTHSYRAEKVRRKNQRRLGVFRNRLYMVNQYGIQAIPRIFTAANSKIKRHEVKL